jgi:hypothetical protein
MRLIGTLLFAGFFGMAYGDTLVIDNFSCADSFSQTGVGFTNSFVSCAGSLGGNRADGIFLPGGSGNSVSTINSNPPAGAITGTIGSGLSGEDVMIWGDTNPLGGFDLPNLDLSGDSILLQIESNVGGTLDINLASSSVTSNNLLNYSATFPVSSGFVDVLIPLTNPSIIGTGASLEDVTAIGLTVQVAGGGTWTIDEVEAVPEPSTFLLTDLCFLGILTRSLWRKFPRS